jgi:Ca2+-binding EF-hand superfamily protein
MPTDSQRLSKKFKDLINSSEKGEKRREAAKRQREFADTLTEQTLKSLMRKYDEDKNLVLSKDELATMMQNLSGNDQAPSQEEIMFVLHAADVKHRDNEIDMDELAGEISEPKHVAPHYQSTCV